MRKLHLVFCTILCGLALGGDGRAQPNTSVRIDDVQLGFPAGGFAPAFRVGAWSPVRVDLTAGAERIDPQSAMLVIETSDSDDVQNQYTVRLPALEPNEQRIVVSYVRLGSAGNDLTVSVRGQDGNVLGTSRQASQTHDALPPDKILYLTLGSRPTGLKQAIGSGENNPRTFAFADSVQQMPTRWFGYDSVDLVILTSGKESFVKELLEEQQNRKEALAEWVRRGGRLLISAGRNQQFVAQLLAKMQLLPCEVSGTVQKKRLTSVHPWAGAKEPFAVPRGATGDIDVAKLEPRPGADVLLPPQTAGNPQNPALDPPLIVQGPCGLGRVVLVAFDLDQPPFTTWEGQTNFWKAIGQELEPKFPAEQQQGRMGGRGGMILTADTHEIGTDLKNSLDAFDEVPVISFGWVALFIVLYILVVGPLDYLFLKHVVKRLELTWVTFPVVVLVVSAAAYFTAYYLKGDEQMMNKVDVVDIDLNSPQVYGQTWFTVFSPRIQNYTVGIEPVEPSWASHPVGEKKDSSVVISWLGRPDNTFGGARRSGSLSLFRRAYDYAPDASGLRGVPVPVWSTKSFTASWQAPISKDAPVFAAELSPAQADPNKLSGRITSNLPVELLDVALFYRGKYYPLGALAPGVPKRIDDLRIGREDRPTSEWLSTPFASSGQAASRGSPTPHETVEPVGTFMKPLLFYEAAHGIRRNSLLRNLDQSWRLHDRHRDEVVLCGRMNSAEGPAEKVAQDGVTPSRVWFGSLPGQDKERQPLTGRLTQETFVRVFIPVRRGN